MVINLVDAFIIVFIVLGGIVGYKNGAIKEGIQFIGFLIAVIIAFLFKDSLMVMLYENLPFFNFFGFIKGIDAMNILFYQLVAFLFIFLLLMFILKILVVITGAIEFLLKLTVFLRIPSKLIGIVVGIVEFYVYIFIVIYILNMPIFNLTFVSESKFGNGILENTPILSTFVDDTVMVYSEVWDIIKNRDDKSNSEVNSMVLATMLDNKLITINSARKLVESNKITIDDISILDNYSDSGNFLDELKGRYNNG